MNELSIDKKKNIAIALLSGVLVSVATTLVMILLFALLIRFFSIPDGVIFPINQLIKVISLFIGTLVFNKKIKKHGLKFGLMLGLLFFVVSYILFAILQGNISWTLANFFDLLLTSLMGGIVGLITVHLIK